MIMDEIRLDPEAIESIVLKTLAKENIALRNQLEQLTARVDNMAIHIVNLEKRLADDERDIEDLMKW